MQCNVCQTFSEERRGALESEVIGDVKLGWHQQVSYVACESGLHCNQEVSRVVKVAGDVKLGGHQQFSNVVCESGLQCKELSI